MSEQCPTCNVDLNENLECQQCGFSGLGLTTVETEITEESLPIQPVEPDSDADQEPSYPNTSGDRDYDDFDDHEEDDANVGTERSRFDVNEGGRVENVIMAREVIIGPRQSSASEVEDKSLIEFTQSLPSLVQELHIPEFASEELNNHIERLRDEHLILISCPDEDIALSAAHALIDGLNLPEPTRKRLLNFDKTGSESSQPSIYNLVKDRNPAEHIVVLADAATEKGKQFLQPIITAARAASIAIQDDLRQSEMYLICLTNFTDLEDLLRVADEGSRRQRELRFSCWRLPFLGRLLKLHQLKEPENVEAQLIDQRQRGWWSPNDSDFYFEVRSLITSSQLLDRIRDNEKRPPIGPIADLFKGNEPLLDTVLYVATFFSNLTPYEFNQLVPKLLDGAAHGPNTDSKLNGDVRAADDSSLHLWRTVPDHVLKTGRLATIPTREATSGVNFINHTLRETLREHLSREYRFFLENKFQQIQNLGLLFDRSTRISQSVMQLSVDMATSYPEYYGSDWLASLVTDFESSIDSIEPRAWAFIDETNHVRARKRFYQTITTLLGKMLLEPRLWEVIDGFLDQLVFRKHYVSLLEIIKRLQFEPSFDQFKWLKQLFHRGNQDIREQAAEYLRGHLKRSGVRVYQALESLEAWLPGQDRSLDIPARYALRIVYSYLHQTVFKFDKRYFGAWPSVCPLFAFKDAEEAATKLSLLLRWIFHWGMARVFKDQNGLLTNCFFILRGLGKKASLPRHDDDQLEPHDPFDAFAACELLLQLIAHRANAGQQVRLLDEWREENGTLLRQMGTLRYGSAPWEELVWKRELIVELAASYDQILNSKAVVQEEREGYVDVKLS
jgi:hypothetical protein